METMAKRINITKILSNPVLRQDLIVRVIMVCQEHEGRDANKAEATRAYTAVAAERRKR